MKLVMYSGNDFIAAIDVSSNQLTQPGYIGTLKRKLLEDNKYDSDIRSGEVEFFLVNLQGKKGNSPWWFA